MKDCKFQVYTVMSSTFGMNLSKGLKRHLTAMFQFKDLKTVLTTMNKNTKCKTDIEITLLREYLPAIQKQCLIQSLNVTPQKLTAKKLHCALRGKSV